VRDFYQKNNLMEPYRRQLLEEKVINFLLDQAEITEVDAPATDSEQEETKREENS
jgi:hypothetical protein